MKPTVFSTERFDPTQNRRSKMRIHAPHEMEFKLQSFAPQLLTHIQQKHLVLARLENPHAQQTRSRPRRA